MSVLCTVYNINLFTSKISLGYTAFIYDSTWMWTRQDTLLRCMDLLKYSNPLRFADIWFQDFGALGDFVKGGTINPMLKRHLVQSPLTRHINII